MELFICTGPGPMAPVEHVLQCDDGILCIGFVSDGKELFSVSIDEEDFSLFLKQADLHFATERRRVGQELDRTSPGWRDL